MYRFIALIPLVLLIAGLSGCQHCDDCCDGASSPVPVAPSESPAPVKTVQPAMPLVTGKWTGRWTTTNGHGGGLTCETKEMAPNKWEALFVAEFGYIGRYSVKLEGKPGNGEVLFGGKVDLGLGEAGIFNWTGKANATEFTGEFEGGGEKGSFKMTRAK